MVDLEPLYRETIARCAPDRLVPRVADPSMPRNVVAIGKCAAGMYDGFAGVVRVASALVIVPEGYPGPAEPVPVLRGGHPAITESSFAAGAALLHYVDEHDQITFLISGGGSACVEAPLRPFFSEDDVAAVNAALVAAGIPIGAINTVRKHLSAIKGGRLAARVRGRSVSLVYSDVSKGDLASVASGPTMPDQSTIAEAIAILERIGGCDRIVTTLREESVPETVQEIANAEAWLVADNGRLTDTAARLAAQAGWTIVRWPEQLESEVGQAARDLAGRARSLAPQQMIVAGGEPTVVVRGNGRGGRCLELAARFALEMERDDLPIAALFGSSDGVDGNSAVAGVTIDLPQRIDRAAITARLATSDSLPAAGDLGRPIIIPPTGNNLRDLYLVARP